MHGKGCFQLKLQVTSSAEVCASVCMAIPMGTTLPVIHERPSHPWFWNLCSVKGLQCVCCKEKSSLTNQMTTMHQPNLLPELAVTSLESPPQLLVAWTARLLFGNFTFPTPPWPIPPPPLQPIHPPLLCSLRLVKTEEYRQT